MFPIVAHAATTYAVIGKVSDAIINPLIRLMFAVAIVVFLWGVIEMLVSSDDAEKLATGRRHMFWGIIGLFVMVSAFGLINLVIDFLGQLSQ